MPILSSRALAILATAGLLAGCATTPSGPVEETGALAAGDKTLATGELMDSYPVSLKEGQWIRIGLHSTDFDPYLILRMPSGTASENDDAVEYDAENSQILFQVTQAGQYEIAVTTYKSGENGAYTLQYEVSDTELPVVRNPDFEVAGRVEKTGALEDGDRTLQAGELMDAYPVHLTAGQEVRIHLHSTAFDPYIMFKKPDGDVEQNDDATEGDSENAELVFRADAEGDYAVIVTSFTSGESGAYTLTIEPTAGGAATPKAGAAAPDSAGAGVTI